MDSTGGFRSVVEMVRDAYGKDLAAALPHRSEESRRRCLVGWVYEHPYSGLLYRVRADPGLVQVRRAGTDVRCAGI